MIESMLNRFWVDDVSEKAIIALIESTPGCDALSLLNGMKKGAFAELERSVDGDNYYQYHLAIQRIYFSALQPEAAYLQMMKARKFPWSDPGFIAFATGTKKFLYDAMELTGHGKIRLQIYPQQAPLPFSMHLEYELDALEMIQIEMFTGTEELGTKIGDHIYAPAITLFALKNTQSAREPRFVLDFSLLAIGGDGLVAAKTIPAVVLAAVDIALGAGDMAVNEYRSAIAQSESGKRFLSTWDTVQFLLGVYGLARLLKESPRIFLDLRRLYREYRASKEVAKNPELIRELNQKLKGIVDDREVEQYLDEAGKKRPHADPANVSIESHSTVNQHQAELRKGSLKIVEGGDYSESETRVAKYLADQGFDVVLRPPMGRRSATGNTSDLLLDGKNFDIYTPKTANPDRIISAMADKNNQAVGIVLDLSETTVRPEDLGDIMNRLKKLFEKQGKELRIREVIILE